MSETDPKASNPVVPVLLAVLAVGAIGGLAWSLMKRAPEPPPEAPVAAPPVQVVPRDPPLPKATDTDTRLRELLGPLSALPAWAAWLKQSELLDRWVVIIDNLVNDETPRKQLAFLAPSQPFRARTEGGKALTDPKSEARYDTVGAVAESVDAQKFGEAWRLLQPLLNIAWRGSGHPGGNVRDGARKALQRIIDTPVANGPLELQRDGVVWVYADPKFEKLGANEKHLLRMGPKNQRAVQAKAKELLAQIE